MKTQRGVNGVRFQTVCGCEHTSVSMTPGFPLCTFVSFVVKAFKGIDHKGREGRRDGLGPVREPWKRQIQTGGAPLHLRVQPFLSRRKRQR
jgi:hypothetical protein